MRREERRGGEEMRVQGEEGGRQGKEVEGSGEVIEGETHGEKAEEREVFERRHESGEVNRDGK